MYFKKKKKYIAGTRRGIKSDRKGLVPNSDPPPPPPPPPPPSIPHSIPTNPLMLCCVISLCQLHEEVSTFALKLAQAALVRGQILLDLLRISLVLDEGDLAVEKREEELLLLLLEG